MAQKCGTIALLGLPNAGKSSLLNRLIGQKIAPVTYKPNTTRRVVNGILTRHQVQFIFVDTPGMIARGHIPDADLIAWVVDAKKPVQNLPVQLPANRVLILNQIDRFANKREILPVISEWQTALQPREIYPVSAKTGDGLESMLDSLGLMLPERSFLFDSELMTDASEKELVAELIREKALFALQQEIPHAMEVVIDAFDETRRENSKKCLVDISASLIVARESHKSIAIGRGGSKLKEIGEKARRDLEYLLGCQVMLRLFVKAKKH
ncbi:MAG: GTPase Era [Myxococcaceae bacterium]|nr:GTPase Era [Myxococcaceae bacterium]MBH2006699.1 GTPase Era [Myxococcaceae bacterium]